MKIGYIRVSTEEQNTARQEVLLRELGVDEVFVDKASGKSTDRSELRRMMEYVRKGDTVIVESISRFARNTRDLLELVERLTAKEVEFVSKKEPSIARRRQESLCSQCLLQSLSSSASTFSSGSARASPSPNSRASIPAASRCLCRITSRRSSPSGNAARSPQPEAMRRTGLKPNTFYRRLRQMQ